MRLLLVLLTLPLAWTAFSVLYYGFPFPNPAYAKLSSGVPSEALLRQGMHYLESAVVHDPLTPFAIAAFLVSALIVRDLWRAMLAAGVFLNVCYVLWAGGDFMRGRFWMPAFIVSAVSLWKLALKAGGRKVAIVVTLCALAYCGWRRDNLAMLTPLDWGLVKHPMTVNERDEGIVDERFFYFRYNSLYAYVRSNQDGLPNHPWCRGALALRDAEPTFVGQAEVIGMVGWCAGTRVRLIDRMGLAEPLLGRLPIKEGDEWRIGHYKRAIPAGYKKTVVQGRNFIEDPALHAYYGRLSSVTRSPELLSWQRLVAIVRLNLGMDEPPGS